MEPWLILLTLFLIGVVVYISWRLFSRRSEIPCPPWLSWMVEMENPFTKYNRADFIIEHLAIEPGMRVLDAGCGPGRVTIPLAKAVGPQGEVVALDMEEKMLLKLKQKIENNHLENITLLKSGLGNGAFSETVFDRITLVTVLGEIPNREAALTELYAALKPGGILSISEVALDPHFTPRKTVVRLGEEAGFREKDFFGKKLAFTIHLEK